MRSAGAGQTATHSAQPLHLVGSTKRPNFAGSRPRAAACRPYFDVSVKWARTSAASASARSPLKYVRVASASCDSGMAIAYRAESGHTLTHAMQPVQASARKLGQRRRQAAEVAAGRRAGRHQAARDELVGRQLASRPRRADRGPGRRRRMPRARRSRSQAASARSCVVESAAVTSMAVSYASAISSRLASTTAGAALAVEAAQAGSHLVQQPVAVVAGRGRERRDAQEDADQRDALHAQHELGARCAATRHLGGIEGDEADAAARHLLACPLRHRRPDRGGIGERALDEDGAAVDQAGQGALVEAAHVVERHEVDGLQLGMEPDRLVGQGQEVGRRQALLLRAVARIGLHVLAEQLAHDRRQQLVRRDAAEPADRVAAQAVCPLRADARRRPARAPTDAGCPGSPSAALRPDAAGPASRRPRPGHRRRRPGCRARRRPRRRSGSTRRARHGRPAPPSARG